MDRCFLNTDLMNNPTWKWANFFCHIAIHTHILRLVVWPLDEWIQIPIRAIIFEGWGFECSPFLGDCSGPRCCCKNRINGLKLDLRTPWGTWSRTPSPNFSLGSLLPPHSLLDSCLCLLQICKRYLCQTSMSNLLSTFWFSRLMEDTSAALGVALSGVVCVHC